MNNKILARVVAVVMAIAMLGTVSFAKTYNNVATPSKEGITTQATKTVLAVKSETGVAATTSITDENILAVKQLTGDYPTSIDVDTNRLGDAEYIVVFFGGSNGITDSVAIETNPVKDAILTRISVQDNVVLDGVKYTNVVCGEYTYTNNSGATEKIASYGITLAKYADEETTTPNEGTAVEFNDDIADGSTFELANGATLKITGIVYGVPTDANVAAVSGHVSIVFTK